MTQEQNSNRDKTAVDYVLGDKPTEFQLKLLQLGRELDWDENDPGFAVPLAMGQVEHVLESYPAKLQATMDEISKRSEMKWADIQAALKVSAMRGEQTAQRIDRRLVEVKGLLDLEIVQVQGLMQKERLEFQKAMRQEQAALQQLMADERAAMTEARSQIQQLMEDERTAMAEERSQVQQLMADERATTTQQAQDLAEQQKQVIEKHTTDLIAQGVVANQRRSETQVKEIVASSKAAYYWQSLGGACLGAVAVICLMLLAQALARYVSPWEQFGRWNQNQLQACRDVDSNTCNFHIKPPQ